MTKSIGFDSPVQNTSHKDSMLKADLNREGQDKKRKREKGERKK
jgi:hypothetical protein